MNNEYEKIMYDIAIELYDKYNDEIATMYDHLGEGIFSDDIKYVEDAEREEEIYLLKQNLKRIIEEKDKQINLMAGYITNLDIDEDIFSKIKKECDEYDFGLCEKCVRQYFETKAKEEK